MRVVHGSAFVSPYALTNFKHRDLTGWGFHKPSCFEFLHTKRVCLQMGFYRIAKPFNAFGCTLVSNMLVEVALQFDL